MSTYQLGRSVAYSIGSALSATLLVASMPANAHYPLSSGYSDAADFGIAILVIALIVSAIFALTARRGTTRGATPIA